MCDYFVAFDTNLVQVSMLNGTNFLKWKKILLVHLGLMDLNLCFRVSAIPTAPTKESNADANVQYEK